MTRDLDIPSIERSLGLRSVRGLSRQSNTQSPPVQAILEGIKVIAATYVNESSNEIRSSLALQKDAHDLLTLHGPAIWPGPEVERPPWLVEPSETDDYPHHLYFTKPDDRQMLQERFHQLVVEKCCNHRRNQKQKNRRLSAKHISHDSPTPNSPRQQDLPWSADGGKRNGGGNNDVEMRDYDALPKREHLSAAVDMRKMPFENSFSEYYIKDSSELDFYSDGQSRGKRKRKLPQRYESAHKRSRDGDSDHDSDDIGEEEQEGTIRGLPSLPVKLKVDASQLRVIISKDLDPETFRRAPQGQTRSAESDKTPSIADGFLYQGELGRTRLQSKLGSLNAGTPVHVTQYRDERGKWYEVDTGSRPHWATDERVVATGAMQGWPPSGQVNRRAGSSRASSITRSVLHPSERRSSVTVQNREENDGQVPPGQENALKRPKKQIEHPVRDIAVKHIPVNQPQNRESQKEVCGIKKTLNELPQDATQPLGQDDRSEVAPTMERPERPRTLLQVLGTGPDYIRWSVQSRNHLPANIPLPMDGHPNKSPSIPPKSLPGLDQDRNAPSSQPEPQAQPQESHRTGVSETPIPVLRTLYAHSKAGPPADATHLVIQSKTKPDSLLDQTDTNGLHTGEAATLGLLPITAPLLSQAPGSKRVIARDPAPQQAQLENRPNEGSATPIGTATWGTGVDHGQVKEPLIQQTAGGATCDVQHAKAAVYTQGNTTPVPSIDVQVQSITPSNQPEFGHLKGLQPGECIDDETLHQAMHTLVSVESHHVHPVFTSAQVLEVEKKADPDLQQRRLDAINIIFVPFCRKSHWKLGIIDRKKLNISVLNSMGEGNASQDIKVLRQYCTINLPSGEFSVVDAGFKLPQQQDTFNCGIYVVVAASIYSHGEQANADAILRLVPSKWRMVCSILLGGSDFSRIACDTRTLDAGESSSMETTLAIYGKSMDRTRKEREELDSSYDAVRALLGKCRTSFERKIQRSLRTFNNAIGIRFLVDEASKTTSALVERLWDRAIGTVDEKSKAAQMGTLQEQYRRALESCEAYLKQQSHL